MCSHHGMAGNAAAVLTALSYIEIMLQSQSADLEIQFLYFDGCPNATQTLSNPRSALDEIGLEIESRMIDVDPSWDSADEPDSASNRVGTRSLRTPASRRKNPTH